MFEIAPSPKLVNYIFRTVPYGILFFVGISSSCSPRTVASDLPANVLNLFDLAILAKSTPKYVNCYSGLYL